MSRITLDFPEETLVALQLTPEQFAVEMRFAAAVKLYELGRLSAGAASVMAGVPKPDFLHRLGDYGVDTFDLNDEELDQEIRIA